MNQVSEVTRSKNQLEVLVAQLLWENQRLRSGLPVNQGRR